MPARVRVHPARLAGIFYLLTFVTGVAAVAGARLIVPGDAGATARNVLANEDAFRIGFAAYVANVVCYLAVTLFLYATFEGAQPKLSILAVFFSLVGCSIQACASAFQLGALAMLEGSPYLAVAFEPVRREALALFLLKLHAEMYDVGFVFFGFYCLAIGASIARSRTLPRFVAVSIAISGLAWITFAWPPLAIHLTPYNRVIGACGEGILTIWLIVRSPRSVLAS